MRDRADEPQPKDYKGGPPAWLSAKAVEIWNELYPELSACGMITVADVKLFAAYCEKWAEWHGYKEKIKKTSELIKSPKGYVQQNPYVSMANRVFDQMIKLGSEFGMTPSSRSRVSAANKDAESKKENKYF